MNIEKIYVKNAAFQKLEVLKTNRNKRYKYREFFAEGVRNLNEAVKNHWNFSSLIYTRERRLSDWAEQMIAGTPTEVNYELTSDLMNDLSGKEDASELMAVIKMREDSFSELVLPDNPLLALFDRPSNHGNLGTVIRSCDAFGISGLILTGHSVDLYEPNVITSTMGSFFRMPVIRIADNNTLLSVIEQMKARFSGFQTVGTTAHHQKTISEINFRLPSLIMIGNETDGLSRALKEQSDILATIPMAPDSSASSFNVACAATVCFYEAVRQRAIS